MSVYEDIYKKNGLSSTQGLIIDLVGEDKKILEIGSSSGYMTEYFLKNNCQVDIVEKDLQSIKKISKKVKNLINSSIEDSSIYKKLSKNYDFIVMADVIEHLIDPKKALLNLKKNSNKNTQLIISTPNIACWPIRKDIFFKGFFEYQDSGILDETHLHLFTINSLPKLLLKSGWVVKGMIGTSTRLPFEGFINKIPIINLLFNNILKNKITNRFKNLSYVHFVTIAS